MNRPEILGPTVAGRWYPSSPDELQSLVDGLLRAEPDSPADTLDGLVALVAPHAGFVYSGRVAGMGFRRARPRGWERVLLLGPSHYVAFDGGCVPAATAYRTPLGEVPIDVEAVARLAGRNDVRVDDGPFRPEHSLEAEVPFLQARLEPGWRLLPLLIGGGSAPQSGDAVADAIAPLLDERTLLVVSSDFTHYGPRFGYVPFTREVPQSIRELDMGAVEQIVAGDRRGLQEYVARTGATICGRAAIDVLLAVLGPDVAGQLLAYDTSGRMTGDWEHSVSYASLAFRRGD